MATESWDLVIATSDCSPPSSRGLAELGLCRSAVEIDTSHKPMTACQEPDLKAYFGVLEEAGVSFALKKQLKFGKNLFIHAPF